MNEQSLMTSKQEYVAKLTTEELYKTTYQIYRQLSTAVDSTSIWWLKNSLNVLHQVAPKITAAAHTSFSMRDLYHN